MTTTPDRIDAARALELLRAAVAQDGYGPRHVYSYVGQTCVYEKGGVPACLVGHALALDGVTVRRLRELDRQGPYAVQLSHHLRRVTKGAARVFGAAQELQDNGETWGVALAAAEAKAVELGASRGPR